MGGRGGCARATVRPRRMPILRGELDAEEGADALLLFGAAPATPRAGRT